MHNPLVSIIIPTYNRAHILGETLDAVIAQTYQNWECIVVDDGSNDYTDELMEFYCQANSKLSYLKRRNEYLPGGCGARNCGVENANANWIIFLDSDDLLANSCLQRRVNFLNQHYFKRPDMLVFHTLAFTKEAGDSEIFWNIFKSESNDALLLRFLHQDMPWHINGVLWEKDFFLKTGLWNERLPSWQDWEIAIRALSLDPKIILNNESADNYYRLSTSQSISSNRLSRNYLKGIDLAIVSAKDRFSKILDQDSGLRQSFRFLSYRSLVHYPLKMKNFKTLFYIIFYYNSCNKLYLIRSYFIEALASVKPLKKLFRFLFKSYFMNVRIHTTFLKMTSK